MKQQAAVDFLSSYGIAIAVMLVALVAMYTIALAPDNPAVFCTPVPGFDCNFIAINSSGVLTAKFAQATGTQITINGVACASQPNSTTDTPAFGNVGVNSLNVYYDTPDYYPPQNTIYSGSTYIFHIYCYTSGSQIATSSVGQPFSGYIWLNYSIPNYGSETQKIATFSTIYS
jgi:hypothetical protein